MTDKSMVVSICVAFMGFTLLMIAVAVSADKFNSTSPSTVCDSGRVVIYEDGSAACVTKIKGTK